MRSGEEPHQYRYIASDMAAYHYQQHQQLDMINIPPHPPSYSESGPAQYHPKLYNVDVKALADLPGHHQQQQLNMVNLPPHGDAMLESGPAESVLQRIFELFEYSNTCFRILLFVFVFVPFSKSEYYSNIRIIASEYYEYLRL